METPIIPLTPTRQEKGEPSNRQIVARIHRRKPPISISKRGRINEGRPTNYRPEFCHLAIEAGKQGKSRATIAAELDISFTELKRYEEQFQEFRSAMSRSRELALNWWEEQGRKGINSKRFNANAYSLQVRNRFPESWKDKTLLEHSGSIEISIESMSAEDLRADMIRRGEMSEDGKLISQRN